MTLREQIEQWRTEAVKMRAMFEYAIAGTLEQCADELEALLPAEPMTCKTCHHWSDDPKDALRGWCEKGVDTRHTDIRDDDFGCNRHELAPTREEPR